jgi:hypothetical protein
VQGESCRQSWLSMCHSRKGQRCGPGRRRGRVSNHRNGISDRSLIQVETPSRSKLLDQQIDWSQRQARSTAPAQTQTSCWCGGAPNWTRTALLVQAIAQA